MDCKLIAAQPGYLQLPGQSSDLPPAVATPFYIENARYRGIQLVRSSVDVRKLENLLEDNRRGRLRSVVAVIGIGEYKR